MVSAERLHLVRHAAPAITPDQAPADWALSTDASVAQLTSAGVLPADATWFTSPEPKARQTAALLTDAEAQVLPALAETGRGPRMLAEQEFIDSVLSYLTEGQAPEGWEPRVEATLRIVDGALAAMAMSPGGDCVLVGHGTAFTLLIAALVGQPPDAGAWRTMRMPDYCRLDAAASGAFDLVMPWGGWAGDAQRH